MNRALRAALDRLEKRIPVRQGLYGDDGMRLVRIMVPGCDDGGDEWSDPNVRRMTRAEADAIRADGTMMIFMPEWDERQGLDS